MACLFRIILSSDRESEDKEELGYASTSMDWSVRLKDITVRIIHAGGREERYQNEIPASKIMEKYPGMCVARPEVFKHPHESILLAEEKLFPGHKYYIIPSTTVSKLKRKHSGKRSAKDSAEWKEAVSDTKIVADVGGDGPEDPVCPAKDFYGSRERWTRCLLRKCQRGKEPFVPPIRKPKLWRAQEWEPSLDSIQEISP